MCSVHVKLCCCVLCSRRGCVACVNTCEAKAAAVFPCVLHSVLSQCAVCVCCVCVDAKASVGSDCVQRVKVVCAQSRVSNAQCVIRKVDQDECVWTKVCVVVPPEVPRDVCDQHGV